MKRYLLIIIGIIIVAAGAIGIIFVLKNSGAPSSSTGTRGGGGSLPSVGTIGGPTGTQGSSSPSSSPSTPPFTLGQSSEAGSFGMVANGPVLDYFVDAANNVSIVKPNGTVAVVAAGNNNTEAIITSSTINGIIAGSFSANGKKILVSVGDPSNPQIQIFDTSSTAWTAGPQGMISPRWAPSGYQFAYLSTAPTGRTSLLVTDASNLKKAPIVETSLMATDLALQWVTPNQFVLSEKPSINTNGSLLVYDAQKKTLTPAEYEVPGLESAWGVAATNTLGLVFMNRNSPSLQLITPNGSLYHSLSFVTLPTKCAFGASVTTTTANTSSTSTISSTIPYLYCGVPSNPAELTSAQLPDDYNMMALFTSDEIVRVNLLNGARDILWNSSAQPIDITDMKIFNNTLFFVNRYNQALYALTLRAQ